MAKKLNAAEAAMREKMQVLKKLQNNSVRSEKDVQNLKAENMITIPGITVPEIRIIVETQKSVRDGRFFSYLMEVPESLMPDGVRKEMEEFPEVQETEEGDPYA